MEPECLKCLPPSIAGQACATRDSVVAEGSSLTFIDEHVHMCLPPYMHRPLPIRPSSPNRHTWAHGPNRRCRAERSLLREGIAGCRTTTPSMWALRNRSVPLRADANDANDPSAVCGTRYQPIFCAVRCQRGSRHPFAPAFRLDDICPRGRATCSTRPARKPDEGEEKIVTGWVLREARGSIALRTREFRLDTADHHPPPRLGGPSTTGWDRGSGEREGLKAAEGWDGHLLLRAPALLSYSISTTSIGYRGRYEFLALRIRPYLALIFHGTFTFIHDSISYYTSTYLIAAHALLA
ncbi:hypothetical protein C8F01DRAFT_1161157, partial [Mycena amicta]